MSPPNRRAQKTAPHEPLFRGYAPIEGAYDELFEQTGQPRAALAPVVDGLSAIGAAEYRSRQRLADRTFLKSGVTFSVYFDQRGTEKIFPFDAIPRVVQSRDWDTLERGLVQRTQALNAFLADVYGDQRILAEGRIPREIVEGSAGFLPRMRGIVPPGGVYVHVGGIDLVRDSGGRFLVLEDNVRTPSGVSYVLENRVVMKRILPLVFAEARVRRIDHYPDRLKSALAELAPVPDQEAHVVVLTPGPLNSAYFEHGFLARRMGVDLVQPTDLFVHDEHVWVKTTNGPQRVDVIYRRVDDDFLDPEVFRSDSLLGVPGIVGVYAAGNVTLANAIGNGVADDKAVYPFVPEMIRFYLSEEPIVGQVETFICARDRERDHVLANLDRMVVKAVDASGGYGMLIGPQASRARTRRLRARESSEKPRATTSHSPASSSRRARPSPADDQVAPAARRPASLHPDREGTPGCSPAD